MVPQRWANWLRGSGGSVGGIGISVSGNGGGSGSAARSAEDAAGPLLRAAAAPLLALQAMSTMASPGCCRCGTSDDVWSAALLEIPQLTINPLRHRHGTLDYLVPRAACAWPICSLACKA